MDTSVYFEYIEGFHNSQRLMALLAKLTANEMESALLIMFQFPSLCVFIYFVY